MPVLFFIFLFCSISFLHARNSVWMALLHNLPGGLINNLLLRFDLQSLFWYMVLFGQLLPLKICVFRLMTLSVFIDLHQVVFFAYFQYVTYNLNERFRAHELQMCFCSISICFPVRNSEAGVYRVGCSFFSFFFFFPI